MLKLYHTFVKTIKFIIPTTISKKHGAWYHSIKSWVAQKKVGNLSLFFLSKPKLTISTPTFQTFYHGHLKKSLNGLFFIYQKWKTYTNLNITLKGQGFIKDLYNYISKKRYDFILAFHFPTHVLLKLSTSIITVALPKYFTICSFKYVILQRLFEDIGSRIHHVHE